MTGLGARFWFAASFLALVAAGLQWVGSDGERYGTVVLLGASAAAALLGVLFVAIGDGDVLAGTADELDPVRSPSFWPAVGAVGLGVTGVGLATGGLLLHAGWGILAVTLVEWTVECWAERSTADAAYNRVLRDRIMRPFEIPALAVLIGAVAVLGFAQVLLTVPKAGSAIAAIVAASLVLGAAALVATRPTVSSSLVALVVVIGAVLLIGGGIVGGVRGHRDFE